MDGLINVLKPPGMTSHDVVDYIRRLLKTRKVGHAGTLDPGASGVLPVCVGQATRLVEFMSEWTKTYRAELVLGVSTDTQDAQGQRLSVCEVTGLTEGDVQQAMRKFIGLIEQTPPMVSALHHQGRRLYELAREGKTVERQPRRVQIFKLELLRFEPNWPHPRVLFEVNCSKGTYVRTLCADLGLHLGCGAHMSFLVRTSVGPFDLTEAYTLEELADMVKDKKNFFLLPMTLAVYELPALVIKSDARPALQNGQTLAASDFYAADVNIKLGTVKIITPEGNLVALGQVEFGQNKQWCCKPLKVLEPLHKLS